MRTFDYLGRWRYVGWWCAGRVDARDDTATAGESAVVIEPAVAAPISMSIAVKVDVFAPHIDMMAFGNGVVNNGVVVGGAVGDLKLPE